jgi:SHAQKYF class myb-like DNA-binding protein
MFNEVQRNTPIFKVQQPCEVANIKSLFKVSKTEAVCLTPVRQSILEKPQNKKIRKFKQSKPEYKTGRWSLEESDSFIEAVILHGNRWKRVKRHIGTRSRVQVVSHAQKYLRRLTHKMFRASSSNTCHSLTTVLQFIKDYVKGFVIARFIERRPIQGYDPSKELLSKLVILTILNLPGNGNSSVATCYSESIGRAEFLNSEREGDSKESASATPFNGKQSSIFELQWEQNFQNTYNMSSNDIFGETNFWDRFSYD